MKEKTKLILCLGSSCYSRGNQYVLDIVKQYIKENNLKDKIDFRGQLCSGNCSHGPILKINDVVFKNVDVNNINNILDQYFFKE
ncbi:MAG: NAD(P)H-dependent oxidoreductase subunit E [Bacteroidales bacterium]|nr:NAD(P)H-dependent oxidoreductase subunit E [Bacteroidales bacterium]